MDREMRKAYIILYGFYGLLVIYFGLYFVYIVWG